MRRILMAAILASAASAFASDWQVDASHSTIGFSVKHMMVTNVHGAFGKVTGSVKLDDKDITKSVVEATIDASSIDTRDEKRDGHLKSPDFFDVAKFASVTFKSTKIEKAGKDKLKIHGDLTIHGVTKPVVLATEMGEKEYKDPFMGAMHRGAVATATMNRKDFGLTWNKPLEAAGGLMVGDDVAIELNIELVKAPEGAAKGS